MRREAEPRPVDPAPAAQTPASPAEQLEDGQHPREHARELHRVDCEVYDRDARHDENGELVIDLNEMGLHLTVMPSVDLQDAFDAAPMTARLTPEQLWPVVSVLTQAYREIRPHREGVHAIFKHRARVLFEAIGEVHLGVDENDSIERIAVLAKQRSYGELRRVLTDAYQRGDSTTQLNVVRTKVLKVEVTVDEARPVFDSGSES